jgi:hypothetical protein
VRLIKTFFDVFSWIIGKDLNRFTLFMTRIITIKVWRKCWVAAGKKGASVSICARIVDQIYDEFVLLAKVLFAFPALKNTQMTLSLKSVRCYDPVCDIAI